MRLPMCIHLVNLLATLSTLVGTQSIASRPRDEVAGGSAAKTYTLKDWYQDEDFFLHVLFSLYLITHDLTLSREWSFFNGSDPSNGNVNYLSMRDAKSQGLAYVNQADNTFVTSVDSWSTVPPWRMRRS